MIRTVLCSLALSALLWTSAFAAPPADAPDIGFTAISGKTMRIADLKGKVVLMDFWASWCIPCRRSFPEVDALHRELEPKGLAVIAINDWNRLAIPFRAEVGSYEPGTAETAAPAPASA